MQLTHSEKVDGLLRAEQFSSARKWYIITWAGYVRSHVDLRLHTARDLKAWLYRSGLHERIEEDGQRRR